MPPIDLFNPLFRHATRLMPSRISVFRHNISSERTAGESFPLFPKTVLLSDLRIPTYGTINAYWNVVCPALRALGPAAAVRLVYNQPRELKKLVQLLYRVGWVQGRFKDIPSAFVQPETPLDCLRLVRLLQRDPFYTVWSARKKPRLADDSEVEQLRSLLPDNEVLVRFLSNAAAEPVNYPSSARVESTQVSVLSFLEFMAGYCINCVHKEILPDCEALRVFWTILNDGKFSYDPAGFDVQMLRMHLNTCGALPGSYKAWVEYTIEDYRWRFYPEYDGKCWPAAAPT
ncbi:hypothetical protein MKEN_00442900 [Mycena kentingensis (nom. inval.)]|nr:hypothetical protein MKEN_00442900 [Mycena kentingensis (nom. inval.)]